MPPSHPGHIHSLQGETLQTLVPSSQPVTEGYLKFRIKSQWLTKAPKAHSDLASASVPKLSLNLSPNHLASHAGTFLHSSGRTVMLLLPRPSTCGLRPQPSSTRAPRHQAATQLCCVFPAGSSQHPPPLWCAMEGHPARPQKTITE